MEAEAETKVVHVAQGAIVFAQNVGRKPYTKKESSAQPQNALIVDTL